MAKVSGLKVDFPGLLKEKLPSGNVRYRVRVEGKPRKRVRLHIDPDHKDFVEHYHAARVGIEIKPDTTAAESAIRGSVNWLTQKYQTWLEEQVRAGLRSPKTLKKDLFTIEFLRRGYGQYQMDIPAAELLKMRDKMASTPAAADTFIKNVRTMYKWAATQGLCDINPAVGIGKVDRGSGGTVPWTLEDLETFKKKHPFGTTAHLCLTILLFTACRIGDAARLGRRHEFTRAGVTGLAWQPEKKGTARVELPILPPLADALRDIKVVGPTYLLTSFGKPFSSGDALGQKFRKWCRDAGLENHSAHGVRKATGHLLASQGCTQYQIMSVHGHTEAGTSEIYTKGVERWDLAVSAMDTLRAVKW
jgi:integrase